MNNKKKNSCQPLTKQVSVIQGTTENNVNHILAIFEKHLSDEVFALKKTL
jgi:hypothetical protein